MNRRRFTQNFKRSFIEQLLSETARPAELCRRYKIAFSQLYTWKKQYADGKLDPGTLKTARQSHAGKWILKKSRAQQSQTNPIKNKISLPKASPSSKILHERVRTE